MKDDREKQDQILRTIGLKMPMVRKTLMFIALTVSLNNNTTSEYLESERREADEELILPCRLLNGIGIRLPAYLYAFN